MLTHEINWSQCETREICSEKYDLPHNMVSMSADQLSPIVLRDAVRCFEAPVQVVQIETPEKPSLYKAAEAIAKIEDEDVIFGWQSAGLIKTLMREYFSSLARGDHLDDDFIAMERIFGEMLDAVIDNYGEGSVNEAFILRDDAFHETISYHSHVSDDKRTPQPNKAFFLTCPFSRVNTVFIDSNDLSDSSKKPNSLEARFENPRPVIWSAKPGATLLFATKGHEQGPCFHATPLGGGKRVIPIVNFNIHVP